MSTQVQSLESPLLSPETLSTGPEVIFEGSAKRTPYILLGMGPSPSPKGFGVNLVLCFLGKRPGIPDDPSILL